MHCCVRSRRLSLSPDNYCHLQIGEPVAVFRSKPKANFKFYGQEVILRTMGPNAILVDNTTYTSFVIALNINNAIIILITYLDFRRQLLYLKLCTVFLNLTIYRNI